MKNLHLLPTHKPSKLYRTGAFILLDSKAMPHDTIETINQHIYITSEEKPKAGDWSLYQYKIHKCIEDIVGDEFKKIILTTDQDLIDNGVQDIDTEFLEWFVKNPSCEEVTVYDGLFENRIWKKYIIIPKEEQKQHLIDMMRGDEELGIYEEPKQENCCTPIGQIKRYLNCVGCDRTPKQETLDEFIKRQGYPEGPTQEIWEDGVRLGAKWQQERMYSEEDMIAFMQFIISQESLGNTSSVSVTTAKYYLEQFKKK